MLKHLAAPDTRPSRVLLLGRSGFVAQHLIAEWQASGIPFEALGRPDIDLTAPSAEQFAEIVRIIETEAARGIVYVHCKAGYSRSAGAAGAWLLATGRAASISDAIAALKTARPGIVIRPEILRALESFSAATTARD